MRSRIRPPPRRPDGGIDPDTDAEEQLPYPVRMGRAFGALAEHLPLDGFADKGTVSATVTIDIDYDRLRTAVGAAALSTGTPISAFQTRRLACNSGLLPIIRDGTSRILDAGTAKRLFDRYQKLALADATGGASGPGAIGHRRGQKRTTSSRGRRAARLTWPTGASSALSTTTSPTAANGAS